MIISYDLKFLKLRLRQVVILQNALVIKAFQGIMEKEGDALIDLINSRLTRCLSLPNYYPNLLLPLPSPPYPITPSPPPNIFLAYPLVFSQQAKVKRLVKTHSFLCFLLKEKEESNSFSKHYNTNEKKKNKNNNTSPLNLLKRSSNKRDRSWRKILDKL